MKTCIYCGDPFDAEPEFCRGCWYSGVHLEHNLRGVIDVLEVATGTEWTGEHTGGGCFWLITWPDGRPDWSLDEDPKPSITVTQWPDVLSGTSTVATVEQSGWFVVAQRNYWDQDHFDNPDRVRMYPDNDPDDYGVHTEELPMRARQLAEWLKETADA